MDVRAPCCGVRHVAIIEALMGVIILYIASIIFRALCMHTTGSIAVAMDMLVYFFSGGIFPIVFAITVRGTAQHAKTAASLLAASIGRVRLPLSHSMLLF